MAGPLTTTLGDELRLLVGLRRTIQAHNESWKRPTGIGLGALAVALTWAAVLLAEPDARADVVAVLVTLWSVGWIVGPILASGAGVLRPEYFTLLPLERRRLGLGLLLSVYVGPGAILTMLALLAIPAWGVTLGVGPAALGLVASVLWTIGLVAISRAVYSLLGAAMRTQVGVEIAAVQYGLMISGTMAGWLVLFPAGLAVPALLADGLGDGTAAGVLHASPFGWPGGIVEASVAGDGVGASWRQAALVLGALLAVVAAVRLLTPHVGNRTARRTRRPLGSRGITGGSGGRDPLLGLPATRLGAVVGKELRTWLRDPWRSLEIRTSIWIAIFLAAFLYVGSLGEIDGLFTFAPVAALAVAMMVGLGGANLHGQDGTALWMLVVTDSPGARRADVRGRQIAITIVFGVPAVILVVGLAALADGWWLLPPVAAGLVAMLGAGAGMSALFSVVGVSAGVDPAKRRNATDAGENPLLLQIGFWLAVGLAAPTLALAVTTVLGAPFTQVPWWPVALVGLGLVNGGVLAWGLGRAALAVLTARLPETFARVRYPGLRLAPGGTGATTEDGAPAWASALSDAAQKSYLEARAQKEKAATKVRERNAG
ncbi:hypothetical protein C8046_09120 [Serinibacter arcticus]|uniref:Integral membrane transport protein n=1 Tax=Serinibacter arcticus TaxID=1655435 RepID=A0A2U1ZV06_9MICO|nr:hypothetical protein [Serinibacter arcticus]PWD50783.1 hypothetical protein C8046_09120 [Serinibacter arcticus]